ncbi:P63C domain-containing protein [Stenotrophomonas sp.]|uniref:P63C domain-containing protein n=1 Tax=Stenotrophomonas sp. TaxID=69392 RepID=UPI0028A98C21|nr:P63C domain-containing protein [Stenotrophomonas sp.]
MHHLEAANTPVSSQADVRLDVSALPRISHHGTVRFGTLEAAAVVLHDGRRGFLAKQFAQVLGYIEKTQGRRFDRFLADFAPKYMIGKVKAGCPVLNPGHGRAHFIEAEAVMEAVGNVLRAAIAGKTHKQQARQVSACVEINLALGMVGLVALIDEATGYQYHRAPDALQDLISKLIRQHASDWQRQFEPDYYSALAKVTGTAFTSGAHGRPPIWGAITRKWVYEVCFPNEVLEEMRGRQDVGEKLHQWLTDGGVATLTKQKEAVRLLAVSSANYKDFEARCSVTFERPGQIGMIYQDAA